MIILPTLTKSEMKDSARSFGACVIDAILELKQKHAF